MNEITLETLAKAITDVTTKVTNLVDEGIAGFEKQNFLKLVIHLVAEIIAELIVYLIAELAVHLIAEMVAQLTLELVPRLIAEFAAEEPEEVAAF